ncbi:glycosyltransferase [Vreelandella utahensis]|uniref:glycosyltransferase n=1 Tax=Vreelandella halophila TaxID=86177 RepID=UPI0009842896|nr:glycosyltransferase [Halomonas utahensis]
MRVLHVYRTYFPESQGGLEETIRQICMGTQALGVSNRVFTLAPGASGEVIQRPEAAVVRHRLDAEVASCGLSLPAIRAFRQEARQADLVHYHFPWPFADLLHLLCGARTPSVLTYHSDVIRQRRLMALYGPLMWRFLKSVDRVVATSPNYLASSPVLQRLPEGADVIPIGLDEASYPTPSQADLAEVRAQVGRDFYLFVGVLRYYKGLHTLLDAVAGTDLPVVIAGAGPVEDELRERVRREALENVVFLGQVSDAQKMALFQLSRAVVFPSHLRSEAFGLTLVEGAMCSRPLISAEMGSGTSYVNAHDESGLVVRPADARDLRAALQRLHSDEALVARLGHGARQRYERLFTGQCMAEAYYGLYQRLLGATEPTPGG